MLYYTDRNDDIDRKRELAREFIDNPTRDTLHDLVGFRGFWASEPRMSIDHYVDQLILDTQTPPEVATTVERATTDTDALEDVLDLDGFGWATATELLHALEPDTYAILNKRSVAGMEALGYEPPNRQTASIDEYWAFVADIEDAIAEYDPRTIVNETADAPDIPSHHTEFEAADAAFNAHFDPDCSLDLAAVRETRTTGTHLELDDDLTAAIDRVVADNPAYRDREDFVHAAIRRELEHAA